jgi:hypothetical protein
MIVCNIAWSYNGYPAYRYISIKPSLRRHYAVIVDFQMPHQFFMESWKPKRKLNSHLIGKLSHRTAAEIILLRTNIDLSIRLYFHACILGFSFPDIRLTVRILWCRVPSYFAFTQTGHLEPN